MKQQSVPYTDEERQKWPYGEPPALPMGIGPVYIGVDAAAKDDDWSTEVEVENRPDGTMLILAVRQWKRTIDL